MCALDEAGFGGIVVDMVGDLSVVAVVACVAVSAFAVPCGEEVPDAGLETGVPGVAGL